MNGTADGLGFVHRFVPAPPDASGATLLVLHGTGGDESDLLPMGAQLAPEANLLSPRGPVSEHGMPRFFRRLALGVFDEEDLVRRTGDLGRFVRAAAARYGFDPARVTALGYSNGANIAASLLLLDGAALAGAVLLRPTLPLVPPRPPELAGKPILVAAGRHDPYSPVEQVEELAAWLRKGGATVELAWIDGGHGLEPGELELVKDWLRENAT